MSQLGVAAADRLRSDILDGLLAPNTHLNELALSRALGHSRAPIREALSSLEREGLVRVLPNRGAFVVKASPDRCAEAFALRRDLEPALTARSVRYVPLLGTQMARIAGDMGAALTNGDPSLIIFLRAHAAFHGAAYSMPAGRMAAAIWDQIDTAQRVFFHTLQLEPEQLEDLVRQHVDLAEVVLSGDEASIGGAVAEHIAFGETFLPSPFGPAPAAGRQSRQQFPRGTASEGSRRRRGPLHDAG